MLPVEPALPVDPALPEDPVVPDEPAEPAEPVLPVVPEDPDVPEECAKVTVPDPNWMACALQGGILPPVEVYWALAEDEAKPDFKKHTRGYLLHNTKPIEPMTEEQAIEYLIMKDIPQRVWRDYEKANRPRLVICKKDQLPSTRVWRNAWKIDENVNKSQEVA